MEFKMSAIGGIGVGKSSLVVRYLSKEFVPEIDPTIEDSYRTVIQLPEFGKLDFLLDILDTASAEEYSAMRDRYLRTTQGFIVVYSIVSRSSFEFVDELIEQVFRVKDRDEMPMILVASKLDLENDRVISVEEGIAKAAKYNMRYTEVSAKEGKNVESLFADLTKLVYMDVQTNGLPIRSTKRGLFGKQNKKSDKKSKTEDPKTINIEVPNVRLITDDEIRKLPPKITTPDSTYERDLTQLLEDMNFSDVSFITSDSTTPIPAHKFVLVARCKAIRSLIEENDKNETKSAIVIPYLESTFRNVIQFLYTGKVIKRENNEIENQQLREIAEKWALPNLSILLNTGKCEDELQRVQADLRRSLIASRSDYKSFDIKFIIPNESNKYILAHKAILVQRSPYFRAMFTGGMKEENSSSLSIEEIHYLPLLGAIEYCYTDDVRYIDEKIAVDVLISANKLCLGRLKTKVSAFIASGITWENLLQIYRLACTSDADQLQQLCSFIIVRLYDKIRKEHADRALLTDSEKEIFIKRRETWNAHQIAEAEQIWCKQLEPQNENENTNENEIGNEKQQREAKCRIM